MGFRPFCHSLGFDLVFSCESDFFCLVSEKEKQEGRGEMQKEIGALNFVTKGYVAKVMV